MSAMTFQASSPYIPIRDDSGLKSLSRVEREFITTACSGIRSTTTSTSASASSHRTRLLRTDGRAWNQLRSHRLELLRWDQGASATVQWGSATKVTCVCTASVGPPPNPDRPAEGAIRISVDLSPSASTSFRHVQPVSTAASSSTSSKPTGVPPDPQQKLLTNRILRSLERILILGGALDTEALCITPGHWVWTLTLSVTVLDAAGGNVMDACALACMAALRHYRKPQLESSQSHVNASESSSTNDQQHAGASSSSSMPPLPPKLISPDMKEPTPLPIHHTPLCVSFALMPRDVSVHKKNSANDNNDVDDDNLIHMSVLMDPTAREELALASGTTNTLVMALNVHGEICLLDFGGCEIAPNTLRQCAHLARQCVGQTLCPALETALAQADDKALHERLDRLQQQMHQTMVLPPVVPDAPTGIPFYQQADSEMMNVPVDATADQAAAALAQTQAEEALRRQALDYNIGHVPSKVRENNKETNQQQQKQTTQGSSALLAALMKSVQATATETSHAMDVDVMEQPPVETRKEPHKTLPPKKPLPRLKPSPKTLTKTATPVSAVDARLDSDEEDVTVELTSEFAAAPAPAAKAPAEPTTASKKDDDNDDVDDLAAAIKKKKKKSKK